MKLLLDTHAFLFAIAEPGLLSAKTFDLLQSTETPRWVSVVSLWEIAVKIQIGKLSLPLDAEFYTEHLSKLQAKILPVEAKHSFELFQLPMIHKDPFDRLIVAQARVEELSVVTRDESIRLYPVTTLW